MSHISRRNLFRSLLGRRTDIDESAPEKAVPYSPPVSDDQPSFALILDRFCLAYQGSFCSVCSERCPESDVITMEQGKPRINPELCTGCKICHEVCPAPKNAIFLVSKKPRQGMVKRSTEPDNDSADAHLDRY